MDALAALAIAAGALPASRLLTGYTFTPWALVLAAWGGSYGLYALDLLPYRALSLETRLFVGGAVAVLAGGALLGQWIARRALAPASSEPMNARTARRWVIAFAVAGLAGTAWYVADVVGLLGREAFGDGTRIREALGTGRISSRFLLLQLSVIVAPLVALELRLSGVRLGRLPMALAGVCAAATWLSTDRTQFFLLALTGLYVAAYRLDRSTSWRRLAALTAATGALLLTAFLAIGVWTQKTSADLHLRLTWPPAAPGDPRTEPLPPSVQPFAALYAYVTCSYPALDYLLTRPRAETGGAHSFYPVLRALQRAGLHRGALPEAIAPFVTLVEEPGQPPVLFNTYTFLYYPLEDFGTRGALAYAAVVALASGLIFGGLTRRPGSALLVLAAAHVATALTLSPSVNKFNNTAWWYVVLASTLPWMIRAVPGRQAARR